jgi:hypothetical protein
MATSPPTSVTAASPAEALGIMVVVGRQPKAVFDQS